MRLEGKGKNTAVINSKDESADRTVGRKRECSNDIIYLQCVPKAII